MSGLLGFGANGPNATAPTKLAGYRVQTSILGSAIPIVGGTNRIAGNVIWLGNWQSHKVDSGGKGGSSKGSGAGKGGGQFTYSASYIIALSQGPCVQILSIWQDKAQITDPHLQPNVFALGSRGQGGWGYLFGTFPNQALAYSEIAYAGFENQSLGTGGTISNYSFEIAGNQLFGGQVSSTAGNTLTIPGNPLLTGMQVLLILGPGGAAPSGLSAVTNTGSVQYYWVVNATPTTVQLSFTQGGSPISFSGGALPIFCGWEDSLASDWINFCLTDFNLANFPASAIGDMTEIRTYCIANGIAISPVMDTQQTLQSYLQEYLLIANSEAFSSEGQIKFRTYGDKAVTGNGITFIPDLTPVYSLDYDAFVTAENQNPIVFTVEASQDSTNKMSFEWTNRGRQYNYETVADEDANAVNLYGLNIGSVQPIHSCCLANVAQQVLSVQLKRSVYMVRKAKFTIGWKFSILEPMDIVLVSEQYPSTDTIGVRILSMEEDDQGNFAVEAEVLPFPILNPVLHPKQVSGGYTPGYGADPGITLAPIFVELPPQLTNAKVPTHLILSISLAGGLAWGGAGVYVSQTGPAGPYTFLGQQTARSTMGFLSADYPFNGSDPDTTELLRVNLQPSLGEIDPGNSSIDTADNFSSLILVDQEIISFAYVYLTAANTYAFETGASGSIYNHRGVFLSNETHHYTGARCSIIGDGNQFAVEYSPPNQDGTGGDIGQTWWFKFTSFNQAGQEVQDLADATAYPWTLTAPYVRYPTRWKPFGEISTVFAPSGFGMAMAQVVDETGANLVIGAMSPINSFSDLLTDPLIDADASVIPNLSGNLPVGDFVLQLFAIDGNGLYSQGSNLMKVHITNPLSQFDFNVIMPTNSVAYQIFIGTDMEDLATLQDPISLGAGTWVLTITSTSGPPPVFPPAGRGFGPPDKRFDHYHVQAKSEIHGGITTVQPFMSALETTWSPLTTYAYGDRVLKSGEHYISLEEGNLNNLPVPLTITAHWAPVTFVFLVSPPAGLTDHYLDGRYISLVNRLDFPATLPWDDVQIDYNTASGIIVLLNPVVSELGDTWLIRTKADTVSANTIGDSHLNSPWFPGGETGEVTGYLARVLYDPTGAATGDTSPVIAVVAGTTPSGTVYQVHEWDNTPGTGSIFIIEEATWHIDVTTTSIKNILAPAALTGPIPQQIASIPFGDLVGTVALVQVTLQDANGVDSLESMDGVRELYITPQVTTDLLKIQRY